MNTLSKEEIELIRSKFDGIPNEYFDWLTIYGCGKHESGYNIYSEPVDSAEIFGELSQRNTGYFLVIGTKGWDGWIGYKYKGEEGIWELILHDAYTFNIDPISEGLEDFLKVNAKRSLVPLIP
ncbi:MAG: hypothetical protein JZU65_13985 [Chlorobium sp.]|nr:hypothetical protein [Chlorobium sp.]